MFKNSYLYKFFKPLKVNFFSLILFELIYKALGTFILFPFLLHLLRNLITGFGVSLITSENIRLIFQSPFNILLLCTIVVVFLYYFLIEITTISVGLNAGIENRTIGLPSLVKEGLLKSLSYLSINNWGAFLIIIIFLPILHIGLRSGISEILYLRLYIEYYSDFIFTNSLMISAVLIFLVLFILFSFTFIVYVKYDLNMLTACFLNFKIFKDNFFKAIGGVIRVLLVTCLILIGLFILYLALGIIIYSLIYYTGSSSTETFRILINILTPYLISFVALVSIIIPLVYFSGLVGEFFQETEKEPNNSRPFKAVKVGFLLMVFLGFSIFEGSVIAKSIDNDALLIVQMGGIITAHRGNNEDTFENTLPAFESAIQNGAEYIEFDVQKTSDGVLVISHTNTLNSTNGLYDIEQTPFDVLRSHEIIDYRTGKSTDQIIPTLDEAIETCKNRAKMNIELKAIKGDNSIVQEVIDKIKEHNIQDQCYLASGVYNYVEQIENTDPELNTLFLTNSNYGDIENLKFDSLSLNQEAIDQNTVNRLHLRGKLLQAWTLTDEDEIKNMIDLDVDFLIVDNVRMAQTALANNRPTQIDQIVDLLELIINRI